MQSRIAQIKRTTLKSPAPAIAVSTRSGGTEFLRMVAAAVVSGLVFGLVSGLLVFLVASHQQLDPSSGGLASLPITAVQPTSR